MNENGCLSQEEGGSIFLDRIEGVSRKFNVRLKSLRHDPKQQHATL